MLLLVEGFEGFGTTTGVAPQPAGALGRLYSASQESQMRMRTGRLSGYALEFNYGGSQITSGTLTTDDTLIVGIAVKFPASDDVRFLVLLDGVTLGMNLRLTTVGEIEVYRGATFLAKSAAAVILANTWYYIEFKVKCNNTTGTYEVRVGGVNVVSASGVDTRAGANDYHDIARLDWYLGSGNTKFDDWYICDSTGSDNNDFLGNCRVVAILPDGDDTAGWDTASGGSDHCLDVDENPADDDTTYVEDGTSGHKDLYDYAAMTPDLGPIKGLSIKTVCRETDASSFSLITPIKSGITEDDDSAQAIGTTDYVTKTRISEFDPNTSVAWTETTVNAAKFGVKVG